MNNKEVYFTTGQFAKLCGSTKETLFHYDEINLFKPHHVASNGYRYYILKQLDVFDLITVLIQCQMSLNEIKQFLEKRKHIDFENFLLEREKYLSKEIKKMVQLKKVLIETRESLKLSNKVLCGTFLFETLKSNTYVGMPLDLNAENMDYERARVLRNLIIYMDLKEVGDNYLMGSIVKKEHFFQGFFQESVYICKAKNKVEKKNYYFLEAGRYLTYYHKGSYDDLFNSYQILKEYIEKHNICIISDVFSMDLKTYLSTMDEGEYIIKIFVRVAQ